MLIAAKSTGAGLAAIGISRESISHFVVVSRFLARTVPGWASLSQEDQTREMVRAVLLTKPERRNAVRAVMRDAVRAAKAKASAAAGSAGRSTGRSTQRFGKKSFVVRVRFPYIVPTEGDLVTRRASKP